MSDVPSRVLRSLALWLLALLVACSCALYLGRSYLEIEEIPIGDVAADMLLERQIDDQGHLLTGHYSRFEFNHPGPFFFYAQHLAHSVSDHYGLPPSAGVYAATMALNVLFLLTGVFLAHRVVGSTPGVWSLPAAVLVVFSVLGNGFHAIWMPARLVMPFFAFFFCLVLLARRELKYVPLACLLVSVLVHGYVSMIALALPMLFLATGWGLHRDRRPLTPGEIRYLGAGALVGLLFVSPMALDCLIHDVCNPGRIVAFAMAGKAPSPALADILRSLDLHALRGIGLVQFALLLGGAYALGAGDESSRRWRQCLATSLALFCAFVAYHRLAPGPMFENMVLFMGAVPMALVTIATVGIFRRLADARWKPGLRGVALRASVLGLVVLGTLHVRPQPLQPDAHSEIRRLARGVVSAVGSSAAPRIDFADHAQWPTIAGVLFELGRAGVRSCTTHREMAFLFTEPRVCAVDETANVTLVPAAQCRGRCIVAAGGSGVVPGRRVSLQPTRGPAPGSPRRR